MGEREFNYDEDQNRDYSDLSDQNQSALGRAQEKWGDAQVFDGGKNYDANSLAQMENSGVSNSRTDDAQVEAASGATSNRFNYTGGGTHKSRNAGTGKGGFFKSKKAAILGGGGLVAASGGFMLFSFFGTLVAPIHIMEIITEKLGYSGTSTELRIDKFWSAKMRAKGTNCKTQFYCRFSQMSEKQVKNLEKAGFKVDVEDGTFGKKKITKLTHVESGKVVPNNTKGIKVIMRDPQMKASWDKGYRGHFHTFLDKANKKFKNWFKIRGAKPDNKGKTAEEIQEDNIKSSIDDLDETTSSATPQNEESDKKNEETGEKSGAGEDDFIKTAKEIGEEVKGLSRREKIQKVAASANKFAEKFKNYANPVNKLCYVFTGGVSVISGVKITRFLALARFSFLFLSTASKIKANQATTEEVQALGDSIMGIVNESAENKTTEQTQSNKGFLESFFTFATTAGSNNSYKSFTESQGWRAMAYNDSIGTLDESASNFSVGLIGGMRDFVNSISEFLKSGPKYCKVISMAGAAIAIGSAIATLVGCIAGAVVTLTACILSLLAGSITVLGLAAAAAEVTWAYFKNDIIAFVGSIIVGDFINKKTVGEDYGNAIISGAGATMSKNAMAGGASTLTKNQAIALYFENEKMIAEKGQYERATRSPFDITSHHTFLGSIMASTLPYQRQMATIGGIIPSMIAMTGRAFGSIMPTSHAEDSAGFSANLNVCQDKTITDTGAATDTFCNPIAGVDVDVAKNMETEDIIDKLVADGDIKDADSDDINQVAEGGFKEYLKSCYGRKTPIGMAAQDDGTDYGENCNKEKLPNVDYYSSLMSDIRIDEGLADAKPGGGTADGSSNNADVDLSSLSGDLVNPVKGFSKSELGSEQDFGPRNLTHSISGNHHNGIDIVRPEGTPVHSIGDGIVIVVGGDAMGYGGGNGCGNNTVIVEHKDKIFSLYCHMSAMTVGSGGKVKKGQRIGAIGNEGFSFDAHLHLEIHKGAFGSGNEVDPTKVLGGI